MTKTILFISLLACVVLFAVPAFAADPAPVTATPQVAVASSVDQPVQLTDSDMAGVQGVNGTVIGSYRFKWQADAVAWYQNRKNNNNGDLWLAWYHVAYVGGKWQVHQIWSK